jgi:hypothetical protein
MAKNPFIALIVSSELDQFRMIPIYRFDIPLFTLPQTPLSCRIHIYKHCQRATHLPVAINLKGRVSIELGVYIGLGNS